MSLREALDRTLLLLRDEVGNGPNDERLLSALTKTTVALIADGSNITSHSAQTAYVTAAMLMARSGHQVYLNAPNVPLIGPQPPLSVGWLVDSLVEAGKELLPGVVFSVGAPRAEVDLAVALGNSPINVRARRRLRLNAGPWAGLIEADNRARPWCSSPWPIGGLAAGGLAAGEAFKVSVRKLLPFALNQARTAEVFADTEEITYELAPPDTPFCGDLGAVDFVSGGAITNAVLYGLARLPGVRAHGRIIEPDGYDTSNLNRYALLLRYRLKEHKAADLAKLLGPKLQFKPVGERYERGSSIEPFAPLVLVGVDHIPSRWAVQRSGADRLVTGATTHWSAMASYHDGESGCAQCLHPYDDDGDGPIPTAACVSFWAGLLALAYVAQLGANRPISRSARQVFLTPFRPENPFRAAVPVLSKCPTCALDRNRGRRPAQG